MATFFVRDLVITLDRILCPEDTQCPEHTGCQTQTLGLLAASSEKAIELLESAVKELKLRRSKKAES